MKAEKELTFAGPFLGKGTVARVLHVTQMQLTLQVAPHTLFLSGGDAATLQVPNGAEVQARGSRVRTAGRVWAGIGAASAAGLDQQHLK